MFKSKPGPVSKALLLRAEKRRVKRSVLASLQRVVRRTSKAHVRVLDLFAKTVAVGRDDPNGRAVRVDVRKATVAKQQSDQMLSRLEAARARAEKRLAQSDVSVEAVRARERAGAAWEARNRVVNAFTGRRERS